MTTGGTKGGDAATAESKDGTPSTAKSDPQGTKKSSAKGKSVTDDAASAASLAHTTATATVTPPVPAVASATAQDRPAADGEADNEATTTKGKGGGVTPAIGDGSKNASEAATPSPSSSPSPSSAASTTSNAPSTSASNGANGVNDSRAAPSGISGPTTAASRGDQSGPEAKSNSASAIGSGSGTADGGSRFFAAGATVRFHPVTAETKKGPPPPLLDGKLVLSFGESGGTGTATAATPGAGGHADIASLLRIETSTPSGPPDAGASSPLASPSGSAAPAVFQGTGGAGQSGFASLMPAQTSPNAPPSVAQSPAATAPRMPLPPPSLGAAAQVAAQISNAATTGLGYIRIQLQPAELGRVDVKLSLDRNGQVMASISADRHDTLALLQHDAPALQHALQQAGLKADSGSLNFSLNRQNTGGGGGWSGGTMPRFTTPSGREAPLVPAGALQANFSARTSGLDIRV